MAATAAGIRISLVAATMLAATSAPAADTWQIGGNLRVGYVASETRARDGAESDADSFRTRARVHLRADPGNGWRFGVRVAGRFDSGQDDSDFWMRTWAPGPSGLVDGQATFDEAWLEHAPVDARWSLRLGRFQASFGLDDVMKKSLDQNDSTNFDITWTDGLWWQWRGSDWTTHVIARHSARSGATGTLRRPLDFADGGSRAGLFLAAESKTALGPLVQRMLTLTWLPSALRANGRRNAYRTLTPARRGSIELGRITLRVHGPLGLMTRQADCDVRAVVRVHPAFPSRDQAELSLQLARRQAEGVRTIRLRGQGTDFESLRDYTPDDESRRIDWAATARALKPIVRTYRAERNQTVLLLLDPWLARSYGFVLSVLATTGLVVLSGPWAAGLSRWLPRTGRPGRRPRGCPSP